MLCFNPYCDCLWVVVGLIHQRNGANSFSMSMPQQRLVLFKGAKPILLEIKRPVPTNKGDGRSFYVVLRRETGKSNKESEACISGLFSLCRT